MVLISHSWAHVLFDTGASHSFISVAFASVLRLEFERLESPLQLDTPGGSNEVSLVCKSCRITVDGNHFLADLFVLPMSVFDVILGMDWLGKYKAIVDCAKMHITLQSWKGKTLIFQARMNLLKPSPFL